MSNYYLKKYILTIETLAPIFIGSGQKYTKKEYVMGNDNMVFFPNQEYLATFLQENNLFDEFESAESLNQFVDKLEEENKLPQDFYKNGTIISYESPKNDRYNTPQTLNEIHEFIRDGFGNPYIPGSSVKGFLRTLYLNENNITRDLGKDNKTFRALIVRDSESFSNDNLTIVQKIDKREQNDNIGKARENAMPLFRECIKPEIKIKIQISVDTKTSNDINSFLKGFGEKELQLFGGAGWDSKVLTAKKGNNATIRVPKQGTKTGKAMLKKTYYNDNLYDFGLCKVSVEEMKNE